MQEEEPRSLPLAARFSPAPGTVLRHSLHHVLAQEPASTTPDAIGGLAGVRQHAAQQREHDWMVLMVAAGAARFNSGRRHHTFAPPAGTGPHW